jgi:hypothetical protein
MMMLPAAVLSTHQRSFYEKGENNKEVDIHLHHLSYTNIWSILIAVLTRNFNLGTI